ncbi:MAG: hypothetical protein PHX61_09490 [Alphaproteobacteria bacterium]|nr:hypothetical protein [Alphaproteobacteria bacterium]
MPNDHRKYLFDLNNFDRKKEREVDPDLPPPPPVFSLEDMGAAEKEGYARGHQEALEEARVSREQYIASQVSGLNDQIKSLLLTEQMREKRYEEEVARLTLSLFSKIFPSMSAKHSIDEMLQVIRQVIAKQPRTSILIKVPQADLGDIASHIALLIESSNGLVSITGVDDLGPGSCKLSWENGGAFRDQTALVDELTAGIEDVLAPKAQKSQNNESDKLIEMDEDPVISPDDLEQEPDKGEDQ